MATTQELLNASNIARLVNPPMVNLQGTPSLASSASTYFALPFTSAQSASGAIGWSAGSNPSRITITVPGTYSILGTIIWPSNLAAAIGRARIQINTSTITNTYFSSVNGSSGNFAGTVAGAEVLNAGDYLEVYANQNAGSTFTITSLRLFVKLESLATS